nr:39S ribosomal protein L16, mitochondrial [Mirounga angustirostris]
MWRLLARAGAPLLRARLSDSWAVPPASAGLKTLLPVPTFEGENSCHFRVCLFSDGTWKTVGEFFCFLFSVHSLSKYVSGACCMPRSAVNGRDIAEDERPTKVPAVTEQLCNGVSPLWPPTVWPWSTPSQGSLPSNLNF